VCIKKQTVSQHCCFQKIKQRKLDERFFRMLGGQKPAERR
jgi:hypothetical protein